MIVLGIESSCDETSAAVLRDGTLLSTIISSQQEHIEFGGIVPELASRAHLKSIVPIIHQALEEAGVEMPFPTMSVEVVNKNQKEKPSLLVERKADE